MLHIATNVQTMERLLLLNNEYVVHKLSRKTRRILGQGHSAFEKGLGLPLAFLSVVVSFITSNFRGHVLMQQPIPVGLRFEMFLLQLALQQSLLAIESCAKK